MGSHSPAVDYRTFDTNEFTMQHSAAEIELIAPARRSRRRLRRNQMSGLALFMVLFLAGLPFTIGGAWIGANFARLDDQLQQLTHSWTTTSQLPATGVVVPPSSTPPAASSKGPLPARRGPRASVSPTTSAQSVPVPKIIIIMPPAVVPPVTGDTSVPSSVRPNQPRREKLPDDTDRFLPVEPKTPPTSPSTTPATAPPPVTTTAPPVITTTAPPPITGSTTSTTPPTTASSSAGTTTPIEPAALRGRHATDTAQDNFPDSDTPIYDQLMQEFKDRLMFT